MAPSLQDELFAVLAKCAFRLERELVEGPAFVKRGSSSHRQRFRRMQHTRSASAIHRKALARHAAVFKSQRADSGIFDRGASASTDRLLRGSAAGANAPRNRIAAARLMAPGTSQKAHHWYGGGDTPTSMRVGFGNGVVHRNGQLSRVLLTVNLPYGLDCAAVSIIHAANTVSIVQHTAFFPIACSSVRFFNASANWKDLFEISCP